MKSKINFKQPKYVLPILVLPFIILIAYLVKDMFKEKENTNRILSETQELNLDIPKANLDKKNTQSKFEALKSAFKKSSDYSSIQEIEPEEESKEVEDQMTSLYTSDEIRSIDSLNQLSRIKKENLKKQEELYEKRIKEQTEEIPQQDNEKEKIDKEMELFRRQMAYLDSIQNPKKYQPKDIKRKKTKQEPTMEVKVATNTIQTQVFNTIKRVRIDNNKISAILDEDTKVVVGSRVRFRLLTDITIGDYIMNKGNYIYGIVRGFKTQRVLVNIVSIIINNRPIKVDLSIYDNDGQEGFYVPNSAFRDFSKDIGEQTANQSMQIEQQQGKGMEQMAYNVLQSVYKSTSQAISKNIKQNKALLKYNTQIYLFNNKKKNNN